MNFEFSCHLDLQAEIIEKEALRYTPAGIPIISVTLFHKSNQSEAGINKFVEFEIPALAAGDISGKLSEAQFGELFQFSGFIARKRRNGKSIIFHIKKFSMAGNLTP